MASLYDFLTQLGGPSFKIGSLSLPSRLIYAPLAGCSDFPFRKISRKHFKGLIFCEMVKMEPLLMGDRGTYHLLDYSPEMHPIGAQLCGSRPELAGPAAHLIEELGFDLIDLNCGCPVDKVTKDGSGSGLLQTPERIGEILHEIISAVSIPVTLKIRAGWDAHSINGPEIAQIAEKAGASMVTIHGRTRAQGYKGKADRQIIKQTVQSVNQIPVAGNGDCFAPEDVTSMFAETGCAAVVLSRGTLGQPWLGAICEEKNPLPPHPLDSLLDHISLILQYRPQREAILDIRRVGCWYCRAAPHIGGLRSHLSKVHSAEEAIEAIQGYRKQLDSSSLSVSSLP